MFDSKKNTYYNYILIIIILLLSGILRIYDLGNESLWIDEAASVDISKSLTSIIDQTSNTDWHPPLYYIILYFWIKIFGNGEFTIRFLSVIFGILAIYLIYKFGQLMFNSQTGIISAFVLSILLYHIRYSQEARSYTLLFLLVLLSNYYLVKILKNGKNKRDDILYVFFSILTIYTHIFGTFYIITQNVYIFLQFFLKKNMNIYFKSWVKLQIIIFSSLILWLSVVIKRTAFIIGTKESMIDWKVYPTINSIYYVFKSFVGNEMTLYLFLMIIVVGIIFLKYKEDVYNHIFIIFWMVIPIIIGFLISYLLVPMFISRYMIASITPLILLFSKGISNIKRPVVIILILLVLTILQATLIRDYFQFKDKEEWREVGEYIKNNEAGNDTILLYPYVNKLAFGYYYKDKSNYMAIKNSTDFDINNIDNGNINNIDNGKIWLISSHIEGISKELMNKRKNELDNIKNELLKRYKIKDIKRFKKIQVIEMDVK